MNLPHNVRTGGQKTPYNFQVELWIGKGYL